MTSEFSDSRDWREIPSEVQEALAKLPQGFPTSTNEELFFRFPVPEVVPILPLRNSVLLPVISMPIAVGRQSSIRLVEEAYARNLPVAVATQKNPYIEDPSLEDLFSVATLGRILQLVRTGQMEYKVVVQGIRTVEIREIVQKKPYLVGHITPREETYTPYNPELEAYLHTLRDRIEDLVRHNKEAFPEGLIPALRSIESPYALLYILAFHLDVPVSRKMEFLQETDPIRRAEMVLQWVVQLQQAYEIRRKIQEKVSEELEKQQRQYVLQQQLKTIQEELGMESDPEIEKIQERARKKKLPAHVRETMEREIQRLKRMHPSMPEYSVILNWLELVVDLPWGIYSEDNYDLERARKILDRDHYDLTKVKRRILEYLAVLRLKGDMRAPILCFVGPPGVGKTSLGKSIAEALGRKFIRISLGGLHDEAEIRGHRRTYIGAYPGRIIQSLRKAGTANPVFMLDEIDKIGRDFRGDPASALLEVLDPEQNHSFYDNYLEMEFDLSRVLFIATANTTATIHPALLDRMEIIEIGGYSPEQKMEIARKHLIPKLKKEHGMEKYRIVFTRPALQYVIERYTEESGVRNLEKRLASILRHYAVRIIQENGDEQRTEQRITISRKDVRKILGPEKTERNVAEHLKTPGVAVGLAWTPAGGDILFIESTLFRGKGNLILTGRLGDVMKESATTALSWIRAHASDLQIHPEIFQYWDIHIHIPEGAIPKDGPSAGTAILVALASLFTQRLVKSHFAVTGEITLRGKVLPVGGLREKLLAARRAGITHVILPRANEKDLEELDDEERRSIQDLHLHFVDRMDEVLALMLEDRKIAHPLDLEAPIRKSTHSPEVPPPSAHA